MARTQNTLLPHVLCGTALSLAVTCGLIMAQNVPPQPPPSGEPQEQQGAPLAPGWHHFSRPPQNDEPGAAMPSRLTVPSGTFLRVRVNQYLSSNKNKPGDRFTATLAQPLVVDGLVVARRGQIVAGRVVVAKKAGRIKGVSRLALQLTDLTLVDGQQVPVQTQFSGWKGPRSLGRDAGALATTTGLGAVVGAAAGGGPGAAIGAGAGAAVGTLGVLLTRGRPTVIYPEALLTFRTSTPLLISTLHAPNAFRPVQPRDYAPPSRRRAPPPRLCPAPGCFPPPYFLRPGPA